MNQLTAAIQKLADVDQVLVLRTPVDVRAPSSFTDQVGTQKREVASNDQPNRFEILVVLRSPIRV